MYELAEIEGEFGAPGSEERMSKLREIAPDYYPEANEDEGMNDDGETMTEEQKAAI